MWRGQTSQQAGFTLIELIISMSIVSLAAAGTIATINVVNRRSADPVIQSQAMALARSYLEEIMLKDFIDPDSLPSTDPTQQGGPAEDRTTYDNVYDFNLVNDNPPQDQLGNDLSASLPRLANYTVGVAVTVVPAGTFGPSGLELPANAALRIDVTVTNPNLLAGANGIVLSGYRTLY